MHQCLAIPEILELIFRSLVTDRPRRGQASVAICARTSKYFTDSALAVLWNELPSLEPLVRSMPQNLWRKDYSGHLTFVRELTKNDLDQCLANARRVRSLRIDRETDPVDDAVYIAFCALMPQTAIFPDLLSLTWTDGDPIYLQLFISPSLRCVCISLEADASLGRALDSLSSMKQVCPHLEEVRFIGEAASLLPLAPEFGTIIRSFKNVREFTCSVVIIPIEFLHDLASWPKLRKLALLKIVDPRYADLWREIQDVPFEDAILDAPFPSLEHLYLTTNSTIPPAFLAQFALLSNIKAIIINLPDATEASLVEDWLIDISRCCSTDLLTDVSINPFHRWQQPLRRHEDTHVLDVKVLRSLCAFTHLRTLDITLKCTALLDNVTLKELATSWPRLRRLNIGIQSGSTKNPQVTTEGLVALLELCPDLEYLGLVFDARGLQHGQHGRPGSGICNANIKTIDVGNSLIREPFDVAEFLSDVLPNVREIKTVYRFPLVWSSAAQLQEKAWRDVERLVPRFTKVRIQERSFAE